MATRRGGAHLHFFGLKGLEPKTAFSSCLVIVDEVETLHETFAQALRGAYGKTPVRGVPRITRMRKGQTRFTVVDPSGNSLMFVRRDEPQNDGEGSGPVSVLAKALKTARRLRDFKNDDTAAAKVLDGALKKADVGTEGERARALAARAELFVAMGEMPRARELVRAIERLPLSDSEREALQEPLEAIERLVRELGEAEG
ncbi:hypothetical protein POL68_18535 [Stigmatella sp. ncwal1]|uniref:Glyoxalase n=1 Tax=Stigmatella ashevillensis TaxID=2995309 RepID=A0ABT5D9Z1_9BACT|nr:hypothetical protein [Stigmatella ashevillena]